MCSVDEHEATGAGAATTAPPPLPQHPLPPLNVLAPLEASPRAAAAVAIAPPPPPGEEGEQQPVSDIGAAAAFDPAAACQHPSSLLRAEESALSGSSGGSCSTRGSGGGGGGPATGGHRGGAIVPAGSAGDAEQHSDTAPGCSANGSGWRSRLLGGGWPWRRRRRAPASGSGGGNGGSGAPRCWSAADWRRRRLRLLVVLDHPVTTWALVGALPKHLSPSPKPPRGGIDTATTPTAHRRQRWHLTHPGYKNNAIIITTPSQ